VYAYLLWRRTKMRKEGQGEWGKYEDEERRKMMEREGERGERYCNDGNEWRSIERRREGQRGG